MFCNPVVGSRNHPQLTVVGGARGQQSPGQSTPSVSVQARSAIATPKGERYIEHLRVGDRIVTRDDGLATITWIGTRVLGRDELARHPHLRPILIPAGSLGGDMPDRDLLVSPNHRVLVPSDKVFLEFDDDEVLVAAKHLVGLPGVREVEDVAVRYVHFVCDRNEVVLSNGAWSESFDPADRGRVGLGNAQKIELFELFPELKSRGVVEAALEEAKRSALGAILGWK